MRKIPLATRGRLLLTLGLAFFVLRASGCYDKDDFSPTAELVKSIITLAVVGGADSMPADGLSTLELEARLLGEPEFSKRTVLFRTTLGTLEGGTADADGSGAMAVDADGTGRARIFLKAANRLGTAIVTATPKDAPGVTASAEISFVAANPDDTIRFVAAPSRAPADSATLTTFTVAVSPALPPGTMVTFGTTAGKFAPQDATSAPVPVDAGLRASADLESPAEITSGRVTATVNGVTRETAIAFERALPDDITVSASPLTGPAGTAFTITATLLRDVGAVTEGTVVIFAAADETGAEVLGFENVTRSSGNTAMATFTPATTTPGKITITVGVEGSSVTGSVTIELTA